MITQSQGFGGQPSLTKVVEFAQFDPSYGTLASVEWRFNLGIEGGSLTVDNDGAVPAQVSVQLGARGSLASDDVPLLNSSLQPILSGSTSVSASTGSTFNLAADNGDGMTFDPTMPDAQTHLGGIASMSGSDTVDASFISQYLGTDMFELIVDLDQVLDFGGTGGVSGQFDPVLAWPTVTLIYEFNEIVPEPTSTLPAVVGLLTLVGLSPRQRRAPH